jgi:membrane protein
MANSPKKIRQLINRIVQPAKSVSLPGFNNTSLYDVSSFYIKGLANGALGVRASAISFSFFMAVFPGIIFLFTLIPFVPIPNFQYELINLLGQILPTSTFEAAETTIMDIALNKRGSLLSIGFLAAMIFSTNGLSAMIAAFNASANSFENRKWISMRIIAIFLVFILFIMITIAVSLIIFSRFILHFLVAKGIIFSGFSHFLFYSGQWFIILLLCFMSISVVYYYAPSKRSKFRFFSAGAIMATLLIILSSLAFSFYLNHFGQYNKLYGSIGTLLALLIWMNINAFVLLLGFELNLSIYAVHGIRADGLKLSDNITINDKFYAQIDIE